MQGPRGDPGERPVFPASGDRKAPRGLGVGQQGRPTCPPGPSRPSGTLYLRHGPVSQRPLWVPRGQLLRVCPPSPAPPDLPVQGRLGGACTMTDKAQHLGFQARLGSSV